MIGGSLGLALQSRAGVTEVRGFDPDPDALAAAQELGAITIACESLEEAVLGASVVVVAAPVGSIGALATAAIAATDDDCVVTDVGSTKAIVIDALSDGERERFIGGHPICGSERGGVAHSREDLFEGATYFLTPSPQTRPELYERLHALVSAIGARPSAIDAQVHDRILALVSHLPHVVASSLIHQAAATAPQGREALRSAGPSFTDLTRVAGANPPLWADILLANREAVADAIADQVGRLTEVERAVRVGNRDWVEAFMADAAAGRARLRESPDAVEAPWRVVVEMPNRPGVISEVATILGHAHINIEDLSLRSGAGVEAGELSLVVTGPAVAARAADLVRSRGYSAHIEAVE